jgi:erythromycin esterase
MIESSAFCKCCGAIPWSLRLWRRILAFSVALSPQSILVAQSPPILPPSTDALNLDFEQSSVATPSVPAGWIVGGQGYAVTLDTTAPKTGTRSLRIEARGIPAQRAFGVATNRVVVRSPLTGTVRLRGYIRTDAISEGYAGLWIRTDAENGRMLGLENMWKCGVTGTSPWTAYEVTLPLDSAVGSIAFGALHPGDGIAWFDSLALSVNGRAWIAIAGSAWAPSASELAWVRQNAIPLASVDAGSSTTDLTPLGAIIGDARIVALGEATHGTSEFFRMKHRLTAYLTSTRDFTVFAIEASMPEARRVNEYVRTGQGDPAALLAGMYFWTWNTHEVLDLIEWMRAYNASGKGRLEFWGFDLQTPDVAIDSVRAFTTRVDPSFMPLLDSAYNRVLRATHVRRDQTAPPTSSVEAWSMEAARVLDHLQSARPTYLARGRDTMEVAWAIQYARIVLQGAEVARGFARQHMSVRDSCMAENVKWMLDHHPPATKAVLWAHNGHVQRDVGRMGGFLDAVYDTTMRTVGFAFGEGDYTAFGPRGLASYPAGPPAPESVESALRATGIPRFALDLRAARGTSGGAWLSDFHDMRSIGAVARDQAFASTPVAKWFDVLIYLDRTTATRLMPNVARR